MSTVKIDTFSITFTSFIASTDEGYWGRGATLPEALAKAKALTRSGKIRPGIKVFASVNVQGDDNRLTQHVLDTEPEFKGDTGYKAGDFYQPHVDSAGGMHYRGQMIRIDLP